MGLSVTGRGVLRLTVTPSEILVDTIATLVFDGTAVQRGEALCVFQNLGPAAIFWCLGTSRTTAPTGFSTTNGISLAPAGVVYLNDIGGLALWAIAAAVQVAGAATRVTGGKAV